jgi:hypothetical protein
MSQTAWIPILTSSRKADAWAAVEAITRAVVEGDSEPDARGHLGEDDALLLAYLAAARSDLSRATQATHRLNAVIDEAAEQNRHTGLHGGLCGLGWTIEHISWLLAQAFPDPGTDESETPDDGSAEEDGELVADIDAAVLKKLRRVPAGGWRSDYDLISGLVGFGAYFLERWPAETAQVGLRLVLDHLEACAERGDAGVTWFTSPDLLPRSQRDRYPGGQYNLGVAHGVPGVIHWLGEVAALDVERRRVESLLAGAVDWLLAQRRPSGSASWFSGWLSPGVDVGDSQLAWCYGDLGILAVLFQVARRARREDWHRIACDLLDHCLAKSPETSVVVDAELCHGAAGVAHIFNRIYQAEKDPRCRDAALAWFERALLLRWPGSAAGGFLSRTVPAPGAPPTWAPRAAFLDGAIGVALALLGALTPTEPSWDRLMLLSGRN